jgi:hypothetical protein
MQCLHHLDMPVTNNYCAADIHPFGSQPFRISIFRNFMNGYNHCIIALSYLKGISQMVIMVVGQADDVTTDLIRCCPALGIAA